MVRPKILCSRCLGFEHCRYDGKIIMNSFVEKLKKYCDFITPCPELMIGLGVPRKPIRLVKDGKSTRLVQPASGLDITKKMNDFALKYLENLEEVDGFILKFKSPSCGISKVKIWKEAEKSPPAGVTQGYFGGKVKEMFKDYPVEDEGRLNSDNIKEHFLTAVFSIARYRQIQNKKDLVSFHTEHKFILMAYNQSKLKKMGKIVGSDEHFDDKRKEYFNELLACFSKAPSCLSHLNVMMHALGYFKKVSKAEKAHFLETLQDYREAKVSLSSAVSIIRSWIERFDEKYLRSQLYFKPFAEELVGTKFQNVC